MKTRLVEADLSIADERTDRQAAMMKPVIVFRTFEIAPKMC